MQNSISRRLMLPLLGLAASATFIAGCGSGSNGNGSFNSPSAGKPSVSAPSQSSQTNSTSSAAVNSSTPSVSTPTQSTGGGGSGADAAFCSVIKNGYQKIVAAGSDQQAAAQVFEDASKVAPSQIKSDAEYVANALRNPSGADISRVTDATKNVLTYYATNCATS